MMTPAKPAQQNGPPRHIVAVGGLVRDPATGRILLIRSPRREWEFPGGQVEQGETLTEALHREIREETGVTVIVGSLVGVYSNVRSHIVMFGFLCEWMGDQPTTTPEAMEFAWFTPDEALERVTLPPIRDRLRDMITFNGEVAYRAYAFHTGTDNPEYTIHEEHII